MRAVSWCIAPQSAWVEWSLLCKLAIARVALLEAAWSR